MKRFVFRNNTIEPFFAQEEYIFSGYGDISQIPQDVDGYVWFYQLPLSGDAAELAKEVEGYTERLQYVAGRLPKNKPLIILSLCNTFQFTIEEGRKDLVTAVAEYNGLSVRLAEENRQIKAVDFTEFAAGYALSDLIDWKFWFMSQMPLSPKLAKTFRIWWEGKIRGIEMKRRKCLVLDLDNTLWGGILGEDGVEGIKIGGDYPGKAFTWWQKGIKTLADSGVILAVCSKNNEADVLDAWQRHPDMLLGKQSFAAWRINWEDKASNIRALAEELNIGPDSMVFVDDNPGERALVKQMLPMVEVPEFPGQPYLLPKFFRQLVEDYFQIYMATEEDRKKTEQYKANAERQNARKAFGDFEDFLRSLEMTVTIHDLDDFNISRIAQMTQKTNQFNLTTRRYTESQINAFKAKGGMVRCVSVADKFGDNGITGCIMIDGEGCIDTFLLSCRILGKGIERAFLKAVLQDLKKDGRKSVSAEYIPTAKNGQVADFYDNMGFTLVAERDGIKKYSYNLASPLAPAEDYYNIIRK